MKRRLLTPLLALLPVLAAAQAGPGQDTTPAGATVFPVGERLEYEARVGFIRVGAASMEIMGIDTVRSHAAMHVQFLLRGGPAVYRLRNQMDSWIRVSDFTSLRFHQDNDEGGRRRTNRYEIFPDSGYYWQQGIDTALTLAPNPLDDASFFYFMRRVDSLVPGQRLEYHNYFKPDRNPVVLEVVRRDTIEVPAGRFPVIEIRPIIKGGGIFREAADGRIWLTDDARRLVVKIQSSFSFANITLQLERIRQQQ